MSSEGCSTAWCVGLLHAARHGPSARLLRSKRSRAERAGGKCLKASHAPLALLLHHCRHMSYIHCCEGTWYELAHLRGWRPLVSIPPSAIYGTLDVIFFIIFKGFGLIILLNPDPYKTRIYVEGRLMHGVLLQDRTGECTGARGRASVWQSRWWMTRPMCRCATGSRWKLH